MDQVILRTPHLAVAIFEEVDNKTLANCNIVSETWGSFIDAKKVKWLRIILKYAGNMTEFADHWKVLLRRTTVLIVKEIALPVEEFFCANPKRKDYQWSPYVIAADRGNLELYQYILYKLNQNDLAQVDQTKALEFATMSGHLECCKFIIANITGNQILDSSMITPFHWAARYGHLEVFKLLFENSRNKNHQWSMGWSPLHEAASKGRLNSFFSALEEDGALPIDIAAKNGHLEICEFLIMNTVDKNPRNNMDGTTALHVAARFNQLEACKLIMKSVVDKNPENFHRQTPLHLAAKAGHLEICRLLLDSVDDKNPDPDALVLGVNPMLRFTPLGEAVSSGHLEVVKLIMNNLEEAVDKGILTKIAVENSHFNLCEFLIDGEEGSNRNPISQLFFFTLLSIMFPLPFIRSKSWKWYIYGFFLGILIFEFVYIGLLLNAAIFGTLGYLTPVGFGAPFRDQITYLILLLGLVRFHIALWEDLLVPRLQSFARRMKGLQK